MKIHNLLKASINVIVFTMVAGISQAQTYQVKTIQNKSDFRWPEGKKMGLSLIFDDARLSQIDKGIPLLDKYGVKATFCKYASDSANGAWIDNVHNIAAYVKEKRGELPFTETPVYKNPLYPIEQRVSDLLSRMTLEEKVGQMNIPTCYSTELG